VPENGYSTVLSYNLQWDMGTGGATWYNLIGYDTSNLATTFQSVNKLQAGNWYRFKIRARNAFGWGAFSSIL
jgi:hypothetical protein